MTLLITFEGIDRSGKHTQIQLLRDYLEASDQKVRVGREPGGTAYGEAARRLVQDPSFIARINTGYADLDAAENLDETEDLNDAGELFGYLIARGMFIERIVAPALADGSVFIADRLGDSSVAYQGYGNWEGDASAIRFIKECNRFCYGDTTITRTYLLDIPAQESFSRKGDAEFGGERDRIEQRKLAYFERVRQGYLAMAEEEPERFMVIDGTRAIEDIHEAIRADVDTLLQ